MDNNNKTCAICGRIQPAGEFRWAKSRRNQRSSYCNCCERDMAFIRVFKKLDSDGQVAQMLRYKDLLKIMDAAWKSPKVGAAELLRSVRKHD